MPYKDPDKRKQYNRRYQKGYYRRNKQQFKTEAAARRKRIKAAVDALKIAAGCSTCGYARCAGALVFHHHGNDKEFSISYAVAQGWAESRLYAEIAKCSVLCANCHAENHRCTKTFDTAPVVVV